MNFILIIILLIKIENMFVYVLQLESNKYYIGKTSKDDVNIRFQKHKNGNGSEWTKLYKPINIIKYYETESEFEEDVLTKKYMLNLGIQNVRGGSYTKIDLDEWQIKSLEHEFKSVSESCYKCGEKGHFANNCETTNTLKKYLLKFNNEDALELEISNMEKLRIHLISEKNVIEQLKYAKYQDYETKERRTHLIQKEFEIEPSIINKYGFDKYKYESSCVVKHNEKKTIGTIYNECILNGSINSILCPNNLYPDNVVENIYKIYVTRIKKEKELNKMLKSNDLIANNYEIALEEINKRILKLYEKYAEILSKNYDI